jgi:hypothetical protein
VEYQATQRDIFTVSVQNVGRVYWNNMSQEFRIDSGIYFNGYNVSSLFDPSSSGLSFNTDSIGKIFKVKSRKTRYIQNLMPIYTFQYVHTFTQAHILGGLNACFQDNISFNGAVTLFAQYQFRKGWVIGPEATYFSNNDGGAGLYAGKSWHHVNLYLSSSNLLQYWRYSHIANENIKARISVNF